MLRFTHLAQGRSCSPILLPALNLVLGVLRYSYQVTGHMLLSPWQIEDQSHVRISFGVNAISYG